MKQFVISEQLAQGVLNYLATQPYAQVFQMIEAIKSLQEVSPTPSVPPQTIPESEVSEEKDVA